MNVCTSQINSRVDDPQLLYGILYGNKWNQNQIEQLENEPEQAKVGGS